MSRACGGRLLYCSLLSASPETATDREPLWSPFRFYVVTSNRVSDSEKGRPFVDQCSDLAVTCSVTPPPPA